MEAPLLSPDLPTERFITANDFWINSVDLERNISYGGRNKQQNTNIGLWLSKKETPQFLLVNTKQNS